MKVIAWVCTFCVAGTLITSALLLVEGFGFKSHSISPLEIVTALFVAGALMSMLIWAFGSAELWDRGP